MKVKHQFRYSDCEITPVDVLFEIPGDASVADMIEYFERYLRACGFVFSGHLDVVDDQECQSEAE